MLGRSSQIPRIPPDGVRCHGRHANLQKNLIGLQGRDVVVDEKLFHRQHAFAARAAQYYLRAQRHQAARGVGRGVGIAKVAAQGALIADLRVGHARGHVGQHRHGLLDQLRTGNVRMPRECADAKAALVVPVDAAQPRNIRHRYQVRWRQHALTHAQHQRRTARDDTRLVTQVGQHPTGFIDGGGL